MWKVKFKNQLFWVIFFFVLLIALPVFSQTHLELANKYADQSEQFLQKAIEEYKLAIKEAVSPIDKDENYYLLGSLYYQHGQYSEAVKTLSLISKERKTFDVDKNLALSYFKMGSYTDALLVFDGHTEAEDEEFLYFYAQTCEKQNLFNQAVEIYKNIKGDEYRNFAEERIDAINAKRQTLSTDSSQDKELVNLIKQAPTQEDFPNAGAIILLNNQRLEILSDYTAVGETHFMVKILNDRGKDYGEVKLFYDSTYEKIELIYARTIRPDGTTISVGDKNIRDVSRYMNYPLYSNARVKIISMPEIADGVIVEYKVKIYINKLINGKDFCYRYGIQEYEPLLNQKWTLVVPCDYRFNIKEYNPEYEHLTVDFSPLVKELNGKKEYVWQFENIPEIISEPYMPPWTEIVPSFSVSSFQDWQEIYQWWWELVKDKIKMDSEMEKTVKEIIKDDKTTEEKANSIYHWCATKIRYVGVEYGVAGFEPHYATEIFKNKYGDCKDQTILLVSMLRYAGIDAYPVLIGTKGSWILDEENPALMFNHCIAVVEIDGQTIFLDPTAETTSFGDLPSPDQGRQVLVFYGDRVDIQVFFD